MKIETIREYVNEIKKEDPESDINMNMIEQLVIKQEIPSYVIGRKIRIDHDTTCKALGKLLGLSTNDKLRIRTIRKVACSQRNSGISETMIRSMVNGKIIPSISIGNRRYINEIITLNHLDNYLVKEKKQLIEKEFNQLQSNYSVGEIKIVRVV